MNADRKLGTVTAWKKTYGFIKIDGSLPTDKELFVYHEHINMAGYKVLKPGDRVSFIVGKNHMGPMAADVQFELDSNFEMDA